MRMTSLQKKADYVSRMKAKAWTRLNVSGVAPLEIWRVLGYCDPVRGYFSHGPISIEVVAFEVVIPDEDYRQRFVRLKDAKWYATQVLKTRKAGVK